MNTNIGFSRARRLLILIFGCHRIKSRSCKNLDCWLVCRRKENKKYNFADVTSESKLCLSKKLFSSPTAFFVSFTYWRFLQTLWPTLKVSSRVKACRGFFSLVSSHSWMSENRLQRKKTYSWISPYLFFRWNSFEDLPPFFLLWLPFIERYEFCKSCPGSRKQCQLVY